MIAEQDPESFDEESCRYFLREIGARVVPFYPFEFGMEEVYSLILEQYGHDGLPDVTSVLQDLLEGDETASGLGDDGDIWRSWRHSWRHRNDDPSAPFIPKIGDFILQNPTPPKIRRTRALRFLAKQKISLQQDYHQTSSSEEPVSTSITSTSPCRQHSRNGASSAIRISRLITPQKSLSHQRHRLKLSIEGGLGSRGRNSASAIPATDYHPAKTGSLSSVPGLSPSKSLLASAGLDDDNSTTESATEDRTPQSIRSPGISDVLSGTTLPASTSRPEFSTPSPGTLKKRRSAHRRVTIVDGALFVQQATEEEPSPVSRGNDRQSWFSREQKVPLRHSLSLVRQNASATTTRRSWFKTFFAIIPRQLRSKSIENTQHQPIMEPAMRDSTNMMSRPRLHSRSSSSDIFRPRHSRFGFDGSSDQYDSRTASPTHLNKALPLNPDDIVRSMSVRARCPSFQTSIYPAVEPSTASTNSSAITQSSGRKEFTELTQMLTNENVLGCHALSPLKEVSNRTNLKSIDPPKSPKMHPSPMTFANFARQNPFTDDPVPLTPIMPPPRLNYAKRGERYSPSPSTMTTSQSEPNFNPQVSSGSTVDKKESNIRTTHPIPSQLISRNSSSADEKRGRPQHQLQTSNTVKTVQSQGRRAETSPKRSRSPMKRLFGIGKRDEPRDEPVDILGNKNNDKMENTKKSSLKSWGHKIRHGHSAAEQEQSNLENLMEMQSAQAKSTFTQTITQISLEPPYQAKMQSEIELMICTAANRLLLEEARANRLSLQSIIQIRELWRAQHRPEVLEFLYDQITQRDLLMLNLKTVKLNGPYARDGLHVSTVFQGWGILAKEMTIRTFCTDDDTFRKHLHDAYRVLEMLGATSVTMLAFQELQIKTLSRMTDRQRRHLKHKVSNLGHQRSVSDSSQNVQYHRNVSSTSYREYCHEVGHEPETVQRPPASSPRSQVRKATGADGAIMGNVSRPLKSNRWQ